MLDIALLPRHNLGAYFWYQVFFFTKISITHLPFLTIFYVFSIAKTFLSKVLKLLKNDLLRSLHTHSPIRRGYIYIWLRKGTM